MQESIFFVTYKAPENRLLIFADDGQPRWITCQAMVDYDTVVAGDKFGNVFVNRLTRQVGEVVDADPTGQGVLHEKGFLMGAPHKTQLLAHFNVRGILPELFWQMLSRSWLRTGWRYSHVNTKSLARRRRPRGLAVHRL